jgi:hypothetical protein
VIRNAGDVQEMVLMRFALGDDRPLFCFAGIWTTFNGDRGTKSDASLREMIRAHGKGRGFVPPRPLPE